MVFSYWLGIGAPKGLPADVKAKLVAGFKEMINSADFIENQTRMGQQMDYLDSRQTTHKWLEENQKYNTVIQETGIADLIKAQKK